MIAPSSSGVRPDRDLQPGGSEHYVASRAVVTSRLGEGLALLDTRSSSYFTLNRSAALLWARAADPVALPALRTALAEAFGRSEAEVDDDVRTAIDALVDAGLLDVVHSG